MKIEIPRQNNPMKQGTDKTDSAEAELSTKRLDKQDTKSDDSKILNPKTE